MFMNGLAEVPPLPSMLLFILFMLFVGFVFFYLRRQHTHAHTRHDTQALLHHAGRMQTSSLIAVGHRECRRRRVINTQPCRNPSGEQLLSQYACLMDDYKCGIANEALRRKQSAVCVCVCVYVYVARLISRLTNERLGGKKPASVQYFFL